MTKGTARSENRGTRIWLITFTDLVALMLTFFVMLSAVIMKNLPFIMITAESKSENVIAAKEAGVSNYIVKPFNAETLKGKMVSVLGDF